jgi:transposase
MSNSTTIAVDIAKSVFAVAVSTRPGRVAERATLTRARFLAFFADRQPATVVLEACGSGHYWARELAKLGHSPILLPAHDVKPYVRRNKTDRADAEALLEAYRNQQLHPVPVKSVPQQTLTALHRVRSAWIGTRTARINTLRGILRELGHVIPTGARRVQPALADLLARHDRPIPDALQPTLLDLAAEIATLDDRVADIERQLQRLAAELLAVRHLLTIPGIGLVTATALVAFVGDTHRFRSGRHFASYLGLTPREHSTGGRQRLGRISKRGDVYLRTLLVAGARSALLAARRMKQPDRLRAWALHIEQRGSHNRAAIALANKLARIAWAVWTTNRDFQPLPVPAAA